MQKRRPVMLVVLDGWGWREERADNAVRLARTPAFDRLWSAGPHALLHTSGRDVGLITPCNAASWRLADHERGTGKSMVITARTGDAIGGRPAIASCAASRPCASNFLVDAGV